MSLLKYFPVVNKREGQEDCSQREGPPVKRTKLTTDQAECASEEQDSDSLEHDQPTDGTSTDASTTSILHSKQAATFSKRWLKGRDHWLQYVKEQGMFCKLCQKYNKQSYGHDIWSNTPCTRLRLQSITTHETSTAHKDSLRLELARSQSQSVVSTLNPPVPKKGNYQAFCCLYFLYILPTMNHCWIFWIH